MKQEGVSLKEYVDRRFEEQDKAVQAALASAEKAVKAALDSSEKAVDKAEGNAEKWREQSNEWRGAMSDRERNFMPRTEFIAFKENNDKVVADILKSRDTGAGRSGGFSAGWGYLVGGLGLIITIILALSGHIR